jgi:hypothetical protein
VTSPAKFSWSLDKRMMDQIGFCHLRLLGNSIKKRLDALLSSVWDSKMRDSNCYCGYLNRVFFSFSRAGFTKLGFPASGLN